MVHGFCDQLVDTMDSDHTTPYLLEVVSCCTCVLPCDFLGCASLTTWGENKKRILFHDGSLRRLEGSVHSHCLHRWRYDLSGSRVNSGEFRGCNLVVGVNKDQIWFYSQNWSRAFGRSRHPLSLSRPSSRNLATKVITWTFFATQVLCYRGCECCKITPWSEKTGTTCIY